MKALNTLVVSSFVLFSMVASAVVQPEWLKPTWERPVLSAEMIQVGNQVPTATLTANKRDLAEQFTSFTFVEKIPANCGQNSRCPDMQDKSDFLISDVARTYCGSIAYTAKQWNTRTGELGQATLELTDHSTRVCNDYKPFEWELTVTTPYYTRSFQGNATPVFTIMGGGLVQ